MPLSSFKLSELSASFSSRIIQRIIVYNQTPTIDSYQSVTLPVLIMNWRLWHWHWHKGGLGNTIGFVSPNHQLWTLFVEDQICTLDNSTSELYNTSLYCRCFTTSWKEESLFQNHDWMSCSEVSAHSQWSKGRWRKIHYSRTPNYHKPCVVSGLWAMQLENHSCPRSRGGFLPSSIFFTPCCP